jgi:hypothetical protein
MHTFKMSKIDQVEAFPLNVGDKVSPIRDLDGVTTKDIGLIVWVEIFPKGPLRCLVSFAVSSVTVFRQSDLKLCGNDNHDDGCECGNPDNPIGQGHSKWCKLFRQEF